MDNSSDSTNIQRKGTVVKMYVNIVGTILLIIPCKINGKGEVLYVTNGRIKEDQNGFIEGKGYVNKIFPINGVQKGVWPTKLLSTSMNLETAYDGG